MVTGHTNAAPSRALRMMSVCGAFDDAALGNTATPFIAWYFLAHIWRAQQPEGPTPQDLAEPLPLPRPVLENRIVIVH